MATPFLKPFYLLVFAAVIFVASGAGYYNNAGYESYIQTGYGELVEGYKDPLSAVGTLASFICCIVAILNFKLFLDRRFIIIVPLHAWLLLSSLWTATITQSAISTIKIAVYYVAIIACVDKLKERELKNTFLLLFLALFVISLLLSITDPQFRVSIGVDGWRGLFQHKNIFALFCFFSIFAIFSFQWRYAYAPYAIMALILIGIILSQSKTALGMLIAFSLMRLSYVIIHSLQPDPAKARRGVNTLFGIVLTLFGLALYYLVFEQGIDFSGRTYIWKWYLQDLGDRVIWGMGGSTAPSDPAFVERASANSMLLSSDNSYIMIIYNLGLIGLSIYLMTIGRILSIAVSARRQRDATFISAVYCYIVYATMESSNKMMFSYSTIILLFIFARVYAPAGDQVSAEMPSYDRPVGRIDFLGQQVERRGVIMSED